MMNEFRSVADRRRDHLLEIEERAKEISSHSEFYGDAWAKCAAFILTGKES